MRCVALCVLVLAACGSEGSTPPVDLAPADKAAGCASTFGNALTNAFGRVDGTIVAVVPPAHPTCPLPNGDHLVLQIEMNGAVYRMVVNVRSNGADARVFVDELDAPLAGPAWAEGWHTGVQLDYVSTLHVASTAFEPQTMDEAVARITDQLVVGARVSVFGSSSGGTYAGSAHLIHRNDPNADGAVVIDPDTDPHYLLVRFPDQTF